MRGEHRATRKQSLLVRGSSPRARGARRAYRTGFGGERIIPACAGSTFDHLPSELVLADHPRVRGEHVPSGAVYASIAGSSPRARGAPPKAGNTRNARGIIPACAGSTRNDPQRARRPEDHPRVRGEHLLPVLKKVIRAGSSPRARGALREEHGTAVRRGIIPACAGSTTSPTPTSPSPWDHPRVRGEHVETTMGMSPKMGSSPRARGALRRGARPHPMPGIIPACAGSTTVLTKTLPGLGDHPRVRGEHPSIPAAWGPGPGSSPRARGARDPTALPGEAPGIIPACAGSTAAAAIEGNQARDHPRVRGEHVETTTGMAPMMGSSPRARGALLGEIRHRGSLGIIPACAGSTAQLQLLGS